MSAMTGKELEEVVLGVVHGSCRICAASLTVMQMFGDRDAFKMHVQERVEKDLINYGLQVFNGKLFAPLDGFSFSYYPSFRLL